MDKRVIALLIVLWWLILSPAVIGCPYDGSKCKDCIAKQMKCGCPGCAPVLRCMARCLWGGASKSGCVKQCDCGRGGKPKLSDCKKCMSKCKCSCMVY